MPRKRRKAINTITTPDIPFQKVRVEWVDCVSDSAWATDKEFDKMNCYGTVRIYEVDKSYKVREKGTKRYVLKRHRDERKWKYKLVGTDKYINDIEDLVVMQREWLRKFMYADGLKFEYVLEEIH